jgi:hypothetical protein
LSLSFSALDVFVLIALIAEIEVTKTDGLIVSEDKFKITHLVIPLCWTLLSARLGGADITCVWPFGSLAFFSHH